LAWEKLIKKYVNLYQFTSFSYQKRLPNNKIPDLISQDQTIIIECKLHDYIRSIDQDIINYQNYCQQLIICCLFHKRKNWQNDFRTYSKVRFWYPEDLLNWIPLDQHATFLQELTTIKTMKK